MLAHVDMDAFYASVEVLDRPELAGKPLVVGGGRRGVVSAASYQARRFGIRSAMPIFEARRRCPQAVFLPPRMERYIQMSAQVMQVLTGFTPLVEQVSVDEAYLDLGGTERLWGVGAAAGKAIKRAMREKTGLTCSVGMAPVRFLAKIASDRDKPDGLTVVEDMEKFLATVSLAEVPGVGKKARAGLEQMGLTRLVELRSLGEKRLEKLMGAFGLRLWDLAHGQDPTGVSLSRDIKSISNELTLSADSADKEVLGAHLLALSQKLCRRVRKKGLCGRTVVLKLKHSDHRLITRRVSLARPSDRTGQVYAAARELLQAYSAPGKFRLIGVGLTGLTDWEKVQPDLFGAAGREKERALSRAEDALCSRYGEGALTRAGALPTLDQSDPGGHNEDKPAIPQGPKE